MNRFNQHAQQEAPASTVGVATVCCHMCGGDNNKEHCAQTHHCAVNSLNPLWISAAFVAVNTRAICPRSTASVHAEEKTDGSLDKAQRRACGRAVWEPWDVWNALLFWGIWCRGFARRTVVFKWSTSLLVEKTIIRFFCDSDWGIVKEGVNCLLVLVRKFEQWLLAKQWNLLSTEGRQQK